MIYCVRFRTVDDHLRSIGFHIVGETELFLVYEREATELTIRKPNVDGNVPEFLISIAFDSADLIPPTWDVFWCD